LTGPLEFFFPPAPPVIRELLSSPHSVDPDDRAGRGAPAPPSTAPAPANRLLSIETARAIITEQGAVFRTQTPNGNYVLPDPMRGVTTYPLLATAAVDAFRSTRGSRLEPGVVFDRACAF
jgi:hypothetical protein